MIDKFDGYPDQVASTNTPLMNGITLSCLDVAATSLGIDLIPILEHFDLSSQLIKHPRGWIEAKKYSDLLEMIAGMFDVPQLGFTIGQQELALKFEALENLIKWSPNVRTAISTSNQYISYIGDEVAWTLQEEDGYATLVRFDKHPQFSSSEQLHTLGITQYFRQLQAFCGPNWRPASISFAHSVPNAVSKQYEKYFRSPVATNQPFNCIIFDAAYLDTEISTANALQFKNILQHFEKITGNIDAESSISLRVRYQIRKRLGVGACDIEAIAQNFSVHPKKLQRELALEHTSFKQLLLDERLNLAKYHLSESQMGLATISAILGYNNVSAFSRAFTNSVGVSPSVWRENASL